MDRRTVIAGLIASTYTATCHAEPWPLITKEDVDQDRSTGRVATPQAQIVKGAPTITVDEPDPKKSIRSPVAIRIKFEAHDGAKINPQTFKVIYGFGFIGLDITDRIRSHANVAPSGISADDAQIPSGQHKITIQVADDNEPPRMGVQTFEFTVL